MPGNVKHDKKSNDNTGFIIATSAALFLSVFLIVSFLGII
jgi:hypothetical protein